MSQETLKKGRALFDEKYAGRQPEKVFGPHDDRLLVLSFVDSVKGSLDLRLTADGPRRADPERSRAGRAGLSADCRVFRSRGQMHDHRGQSC